MKKLLTLLSLLATTFVLQAQTGELSGIIRDENGEGMKKATATLVDENGVTTGTNVIADVEGHYIFTALTPGKYNLQFSYNGYFPYLQNDVMVNAEKPTMVNRNLRPDPNYVAPPKNSGKTKKK